MPRVTIDYAVLRHLRETIGHFCHYGTAQLRARAIEALKTYAANLGNDCPHIDLVKQGDIRRCLDCGVILG